ncbi:hypothetical protein ACFX1X_002659 [Malus domestica]
MQDWNYKNGGCFELTLEISDNKWPTANEVRHQLGRVFATFKYKTIFFSQVYHVYMGIRLRPWCSHLSNGP